MRRNIVIVVSFAVIAIAVFAAGTWLSRDGDDPFDAIGESNDLDGALTREPNATRFTQDEVRLLAQQRLNDYRNVDPTCDPPDRGGARLWIIECIATERDCGELTGDLLAECLAIDRCERAERPDVRRQCTDTPRDHLLFFDDVLGEFLD